MVSLALIRSIADYYPPASAAARILRSAGASSSTSTFSSPAARLHRGPSTAVYSHSGVSLESADPPERAPYALSFAAPRLRLLVEHVCGYAAEGIVWVGLSCAELCRHEVAVWARDLCGEDEEDDGDEDEEGCPPLSTERVILQQSHSHMSQIVADIYDPEEFLYTRWVECQTVRVLAAAAWWLRRPLAATEVCHAKVNEAGRSVQAHAVSVASLHISLNRFYLAIPFLELGIDSLVRSFSVSGRQSDLSTIRECRRLRCLTVTNPAGDVSSTMRDLVTHATGLRSLRLTDGAMENVEWVSALTSLRRLALPSCCSLEDASPIAACTTLRSLDLSFCESLMSLAFLAQLPQLCVLNLREVSSQHASDFADVLGATLSLRVLNISENAWMAKVNAKQCQSQLGQLDVVLASGGAAAEEWLPFIPFVTVLNVAYCTELVTVASIGTFFYLRALTVAACTNLDSIHAVLLGCPSLEYLDMSNCHAITTLLEPHVLDSTRTIAEVRTHVMPRLHTLIARRSGLADLLGIHVFVGLTFLDITGCVNVDNLSVLAGMPRLARVWASQTCVADVTWAACCPQLRELIWDGDEEE